jgi:hypothetical protein
VDLRAANPVDNFGANVFGLPAAASFKQNAQVAQFTTFFMAELLRQGLASNLDNPLFGSSALDRENAGTNFLHDYLIDQLAQEMAASPAFMGRIE